jgi:6-phosphogluconolactonase (cycloisomerase 2 family)
MRRALRTVLSVFFGVIICCHVALSESRVNAVYTVQNQAGINHVAAFVQDAVSGNLSLVATYSTGGTGNTAVDGNQSHALVSNGAYLFVTNGGSNSITSFRIGRGGVLHKVGVYSSAGAVPVSLAVKGSRLLVANQGSSAASLRGSLRVFTIRKDGSLARNRRGHFEFLPDEVPAEILASLSSNIFSVGLSGANRVDNFELQSDGTIVRADSVGAIVAPLGGVVKSYPQTTFVYTMPDSDLPGVVSLRVDRTGRTTRMYQDIRVDLDDPCWAALHPDGTRVWLSSFKTRALSLYSIASDGSLQAGSDYVPVTAGPGATDIAVDAKGEYLFRLRGFDVVPPNAPLSPVIDTLRIRRSTSNAGLSLVHTASLPGAWATTGTTGIAVVSVVKR